MNDLVLIPNQSNMRNAPGFIVKECKISQLYFLQHNRLPLLRLLVCIPEKLYAEQFENGLNKSAAINTHQCFTTPQIRCVQPGVSRANQQVLVKWQPDISESTMV